METRHIRLGYEESIATKKQFLSAQMNLLNTAKRVQNYKKLRKAELTTKKKLSAALKNLRTKINAFQATFPKQEISQVQKKKEKKKKEKQELDIQEQLQEIQEKLERLQ